MTTDDWWSSLQEAIEHNGMHYLTLINRTAAQLDGSDVWIDRLFAIEIGLIVWSYIECGSMFYMLCVTSQYHPNLSYLLKHLVFQYFFSMAARLVQIFYQYDIASDAHLKSNPLFTGATLVRNCLTFIAFYFAPFAMIERTFATYFLHDYESNQRRHIGYIIAVCMHIWCFTSAILFIFEILPVYMHIVSFIVANILAFLICAMNGCYNHQKFLNKSTTVANWPQEYSLGERYQIAENLKTAVLFKRGILFIIVFSITCSSFISAEALGNLDTVVNWMHVGFNYTAILYGVGLPAAMYYYSDQWQRELLRLLRLVFYCGKSRGWQLHIPSQRRVRTTMGARMIHEKKDETDIYFEQLTSRWRVPQGRGSTLTSSPQQPIVGAHDRVDAYASSTKLTA